MNNIRRKTDWFIPTLPGFTESRPTPVGLVQIHEDDPDVSLFQQPWWLDAVSNGRYRTVTAGDGHNAYLWLPYLETRRFGMRVLGMPPMTHTLGPVIRLPPGKPVSQSGQRRKLIDAALAALPPCHGLEQVLDTDVADALDYRLSGCEIGVRYTYRLDTAPGPDSLWRDFKDKTRNTIRRADRLLTVERGMPVMEFHELFGRNLARTSRRNHHARDVYERLADALARRDRHCVMVARTRAGGRIAAATLLAWDANALYYLRATQDPDLAGTGASSLLVWEAIRLAAERGLIFDSDSFLGRGGAMFIEAFGAARAQRLVVSRKHLSLRASEAIRRRLPF